MTRLTSKRQIIVCADDFGQNVEISEGIVHLAEQKRINAISCMVNSEYWYDAYPALRTLQSSTYIGLHLNFTHGHALSDAWRNQHGTLFTGLPTLLKKAYLSHLDTAAIRAEIKAQLDVFHQSMKAWPDFIDGHQHIHQLPNIREILIDVCVDLPVDTFIRKTTNGWKDFLSTDGFPKRQIIALLGGITFQSRLIKKAILCNSSFSGIYNFKRAADYRYYFKRFLANTQKGGLIMCHAGNVSDDVDDPLHDYRHYELNYLMSDEYLTDLADGLFELQCKHHDN